jgi:hypothetical protein
MDENDFVICAEAVKGGQRSVEMVDGGGRRGGMRMEMCGNEYGWVVTHRGRWKPFRQ